MEGRRKQMEEKATDEGIERRGKNTVLKRRSGTATLDISLLLGMK